VGHGFSFSSSRGRGTSLGRVFLGKRFSQEINGKSPTAQRMLKFAFNLTDDGLMGQQVFAGEATRLAYMTDEAVEGNCLRLPGRRGRQQC